MKLSRIGLLAVVLICGCQGHTIVKDPVTGKSSLKDTPFERWYFARDVDRMIEDEQHGRSTPRVDLNWNDWWLNLIEAQRKYVVGNHEFYIRYIIDARRRAGLPELKFTHK